MLKNRQHNIAVATLTLFLGSWLLFVCQACLAIGGDVKDQHQATTDALESCHDAGLKDGIQYPVDPINEVSSVNTGHCLGVCDCDAIAATLNSDKSPNLLDKLKVSADLIAFVEPQIFLPNHFSYAYRLTPTPERAIFLPQQHYTVLLN